jgi:uncharacterized protein (TIGR00303 family)
MKLNPWKIYTQHSKASHWCQLVHKKNPLFLGCFGFTDTALIPGISAAGATPQHRRFTAIADAEILLYGSSKRLPTSPEGYPSPVVISRSIIIKSKIPMYLFNCGLPDSLPELIVVHPTLQGSRCLSTGQALALAEAQILFRAGQQWGEHFGSQSQANYLVIGECVAGGTTTALALLLGLKIEASGRVNSSHPICNHTQKQILVERGLSFLSPQASPLEVAASVGDPMQPFVAGLVMKASLRVPILLAGGTQMLAVYALMQALERQETIAWDPNQIIVGTTRWVAEDPSGDTVGLANTLGSVPLLASQFSFAESRFIQLRAYEQGYVKEGVGAGGLLITEGLHGSWDPIELLHCIEETYQAMCKDA